MSVSVKNLTKIYGEQRAVNNISFEVKKGEILGFLGPNGAGKTTTMKILTCFLPQSEGSASVCGFDVEKESIKVRRRIGYLPEHNPLYKDMYVREYLNFVALSQGVKNRKKRIAEMVEMTGLEREQHKLIGSLSKGYRQRVGLAQAMIHDPEVLILDEPTSGLDPNQLAEIRSLIKQIGQEKTVIFSTHIMQEVQALCDRVVIINKGLIVADDPIAALQKKVTQNNVYTLEFEHAVSQEILAKIKGLSRVQRGADDLHWQLVTSDTTDIRSEIFRFAADNNLALLELRKETVSVEDVFRELTKN